MSAAYVAGEFLNHHALTRIEQENGSPYITEKIEYETIRGIVSEIISQPEIVMKDVNDPVTIYDRKSQALIKRVLKARLPGNIITEEEGGDEDNHLEITYIIDPLDGTKSWLRKDLDVSISIAAEKEGKIIGGVVYDFMKDLLYIATEGAMCAYYKKELVEPQSFSTRPRVKCEELETAILMKSKEFDVDMLTGSIALALARTAFGCNDALIIDPTKKMEKWDMAAGAYLLQCKKFDLYDFSGKEFDYKDPRNGLVAVHPKVKDKILDALHIGGENKGTATYSGKTSLGYTPSILI